MADVHVLMPPSELVPSQFVLPMSSACFPYIQACMWQHFGGRTNPEQRDGFPAPTPVTLNRIALQSMQGVQYTVARKLDGLRLILVLGTWPRHLVHAASGQQHFSFFVDRSFRMYHASVLCDSSFFDGRGSCYDGELVWECVQSLNVRYRLVFYVFDAMTNRSVSLLQATYLERMRQVRATFYAEPRTAFDPAHALLDSTSKIIGARHRYDLALVPQTILPVSQLASLVRQPAHCATDGYLFTPVMEPVRTGRHPTMYKWKSEVTIDLLFASETELRGWDHERRAMRSFSDANDALPWFGHRKFVLVPREPCDRVNKKIYLEAIGHVVEWRHTCFQEFSAELLISYVQLVRVRYDRDRGNDTVTVCRMLHETLRDTVSLDKLLEACGACAAL